MKIFANNARLLARNFGLRLTHFLTHMTARGCDRLPEIAKFVANYEIYKFGIIRDYGRLLEIAND